MIICRVCKTERDPITASRKKSKCKPCRNKSMRIWSLANRNLKRALDKTYRHNNSEKTRSARQLAYYANIEETRVKKQKEYERSRNAALARAQRWQRDNPDAVKERETRRRARKYGVEGSHTVAEFRAACERQGGACFDCGRITKLTRGHLKPLFLGGPDFIENIVGQCRSCNSRQGCRLHPVLETASVPGIPAAA